MAGRILRPFALRKIAATAFSQPGRLRHFSFGPCAAPKRYSPLYLFCENCSNGFFSTRQAAAFLLRPLRRTERAFAALYSALRNKAAPSDLNYIINQVFLKIHPKQYTSVFWGRGFLAADKSPRKTAFLSLRRNGDWRKAKSTKRNGNSHSENCRFFLVETERIELLTSALRTQRSPS